MDGKGAWRDSVFVKHLWRTIKFDISGSKFVMLAAFLLLCGAFERGPNTARVPEMSNTTAKIRATARRLWPGAPLSLAILHGQIAQGRGKDCHINPHTHKVCACCFAIVYIVMFG